MNDKPLPIDEVLPELLEKLRESSNAVLVAEPGAGKTTRVPLALLQETWLAGRSIVVLEPRRLAARSAALYMAELLGERVGETVGYRVKLDTKVGPKTRIEVVTEGVLTRMLQSDPALDAVGAILFDEYHERSLQADLGLALSLQSQSLLRENLRILIMSATLDAQPIAKLLGDAPVVMSRGRTYPVETFYASERLSQERGREDIAVAACIERALREQEGDLLVFLPGAREIRRTAARLHQAAGATRSNHSLVVRMLHGMLSLEEQAAAIKADPEGRRRVVLATSIAESSLTVEGVRVVIDSGLMRVPRYSPRTGMSRLETVRVSQASADQRRGRAGRLSPGACYRLWTEQEQRELPASHTPEMMEADLMPLTLELLLWGINDPNELQWLDPPPHGAYVQALERLRLLEAVDGSGKPTKLGQQMAQLGVHPRLACMLLQSVSLGCEQLACELAVLLEDRDLLPQERSVDLLLRLHLLQGRGDAGGRVDSARLHSMREGASRLKRGLIAAALETGIERPPAQTSGLDSHQAIGLLLSFAYPDRIAQRRSDGRYLLSGGRGAVLPELQPLSQVPYLVAAELEDSGTESRIRLAAHVQLSDIEQWCGARIRKEQLVVWDSASGSVRSRLRTMLGALILKETQLQSADPEEVASALLQGIRAEGLSALLPMNKQALQLQARMQLMHRSDSSWPDASEECLLETLEDWLLPHLYGMRSRSDLQRLSMVGLLQGLLTWHQGLELDEQVPTHLTVPSGSRVPVDYSNPEAPSISVRLQEVFGWLSTPRLAKGRLPVTLKLLSPSQRPVQVTQDLASFWQTAYFEVKKDLKGRYPKHYWPDNPLEAVPTNRVRPRKEGG
ncbi:ATP-dependent helicase HrpB [Paenibacillus sp. GCM10023252]|uniref:ATP-dependent helicase HrpB n=1 Tax=Paenibacillus sp. GCM10023252 TaxID=3252649 RepID=UPI0036083626